MSAYLSVRDLPVEGRRVFLRLDLNVPMKGGEIQDDTRIREALPTLRLLIERGARIIACSHMGRPKGQRVPEFSLFPVAQRLRDLLPDTSVTFTADTLGPEARTRPASCGPGPSSFWRTSGTRPEKPRMTPLSPGAFARWLTCSSATPSATSIGHASLCAAAELFPQAAAGLLLEREVEYLLGRLGNPRQILRGISGRRQGRRKDPRAAQAVSEGGRTLHRRRHGLYVPRRKGPDFGQEPRGAGLGG